MTTIKKKIPMSEFERIQREHPMVDLSRVYTAVPDKEYKRRTEEEKEFKLPEFLK